MAKIKESTLLRHPDTGEIEFLREGANAPAWAEKLITNPAVLTQPKPEPEEEASSTSDGPDDSTAEADSTTDVEKNADAGDKPAAKSTSTRSTATKK